MIGHHQRWFIGAAALLLTLTAVGAAAQETKVVVAEEFYALW